MHPSPPYTPFSHRTSSHDTPYVTEPGPHRAHSFSSYNSAWEQEPRSQDLLMQAPQPSCACGQCRDCRAQVVRARLSAWDGNPDTPLGRTLRQMDVDFYTAFPAALQAKIVERTSGQGCSDNPYGLHFQYNSNLPQASNAERFDHPDYYENQPGASSSRSTPSYPHHPPHYQQIDSSGSAYLMPASDGFSHSHAGYEQMQPLNMEYGFHGIERTSHVHDLSSPDENTSSTTAPFARPQNSAHSGLPHPQVIVPSQHRLTDYPRYHELSYALQPPQSSSGSRQEYTPQWVQPRAAEPVLEVPPYLVPSQRTIESDTTILPLSPTDTAASSNRPPTPILPDHDQVYDDSEDVASPAVDESAPLAQRASSSGRAPSRSRSSTRTTKSPSSRKKSSKSISEPTLPLPQKKPLHLACFFCRGRKIACSAAPADAEDKSCNQCLKRGLECQYPLESRRGQRTKKAGASDDKFNEDDEEEDSDDDDDD